MKYFLYLENFFLLGNHEIISLKREILKYSFTKEIFKEGNYEIFVF